MNKKLFVFLVLVLLVPIVTLAIDCSKTPGDTESNSYIGECINSGNPSPEQIKTYCKNNCVESGDGCNCNKVREVYIKQGKIDAAGKAIVEKALENKFDTDLAKIYVDSTANNAVTDSIALNIAGQYFTAVTGTDITFQSGVILTTTPSVVTAGNTRYSLNGLNSITPKIVKVECSASSCKFDGLEVKGENGIVKPIEGGFEIGGANFKIPPDIKTGSIDFDGKTLKIDGKVYFEVVSGSLAGLELSYKDGKLTAKEGIPSGVELKVPGAISRYGNIIGKSKWIWEDKKIVFGADGETLEGDIMFQNVEIKGMDYTNKDNKETLYAKTITKTTNDPDFKIIDDLGMDSPQLNGIGKSKLMLEYDKSNEEKITVKNAWCEKGFCLSKDGGQGDKLSFGYNKAQIGATLLQKEVSLIISKKIDGSSTITSELYKTEYVKTATGTSEKTTATCIEDSGCVLNTDKNGKLTTLSAITGMQFKSKIISIDKDKNIYQYHFNMQNALAGLNIDLTNPEICTSICVNGANVKVDKKLNGLTYGEGDERRITNMKIENGVKTSLGTTFSGVINEEDRIKRIIDNGIKITTVGVPDPTTGIYSFDLDAVAMKLENDIGFSNDFAKKLTDICRDDRSCWTIDEKGELTLNLNKGNIESLLKLYNMKYLGANNPKDTEKVNAVAAAYGSNCRLVSDGYTVNIGTCGGEVKKADLITTVTKEEDGFFAKIWNSLTGKPKAEVSIRDVEKAEKIKEAEVKEPDKKVTESPITTTTMGITTPTTKGTTTTEGQPTSRPLNDDERIILDDVEKRMAAVQKKINKKWKITKTEG